MRLTKADGAVLLGAIAIELESQRWRKLRRAGYDHPLAVAIEAGIQEDDDRRAEELRRVREKIARQM